MEIYICTKQRSTSKIKQLLIKIGEIGSNNDKSPLMKVREEGEKATLKLNIQKTKITASGPITSQQIDGGKNGNNDRLYCLGLQNHCGW